ncbi:MAG: NosD domain-containing protein [Candidatus Bathyarchaeia archaeon]
MSTNKKTVLTFLLVVSSCLCIFKVAPANGASKTIAVPDDYASIQDAIDNAAKGDIIFIKKGVYVENPVVNKAVSLVGEDRNATIIDVTGGLQVESDNVTITGLTIYNGWRCISLSASNCNISGNKFTDATNGVVIVNGQNNRIMGNIFESIGLSSAIQLNFANSNFVSNNYINSCVEGIQIWQNSNNNTITENTITNCKDHAIRLQYSNNNTITHNKIANSGCGTSIYGSNNNTISNNNYIGNTVQFSAKEDYYLSFGHNRSVNTIDRNYWSDYTGKDADGNGIGDTPYIIDEYNQDNNPLMKPVATTEASNSSPQHAHSPTPPPQQTLPLTLVVLSPRNITYTTVDIPLTFVIDETIFGKQYAGVDYILDNTGNRARITGNITLPILSQGSHCVTLYAYDELGNEASETIYFSVEMAESLPILPVTLAIATVVAINVVLIVYFYKKKKRRNETS